MRLRLGCVALCFATVLAGCGSAPSPGETVSTASPPAPAAGAPRRSAPARRPALAEGEQRARTGSEGAAGSPGPKFTPKPHHDSGGGADQFEEKGGDNSIQRFGGEAPAGEFAQAAATLHDYLDARAAGAWAAACSDLAHGVAENFAWAAGGAAVPCPRLLASLSTGLPPRVLREAAVADVGALRTEGSRAFVLFTGAAGVRYFMPMASEGGAWRVAAIAASAFVPGGGSRRVTNPPPPRRRRRSPGSVPAAGR